MRLLALLCLLFATAAAAETAPVPAGMGRITGKVTLAGLAPKLGALPVTADMKICGTNKPDESLEVGQGGGIKNAVLWVQEGPKATAPKKAKVKIDQQQCVFVPRVQTAVPGEELQVVNSDSVMHSVKGEGPLRFHWAMPVKNHTVTKKIPADGLLRLSVEQHPWMKAYVYVLPTAASAVSAADGAFSIDVPPGKYHLKLWHERLGEREDVVEVGAGETAVKDISLTPR